MPSSIGGFKAGTGGLASLNGQSQPFQSLSVKVNGSEACVSSNGRHQVTITTAALSNVNAASVTVAPVGQVAATNVQTAIQEIDSEVNSMPSLSSWFANQLL